jgi:hypothetical protein
MLEHPTQRSTAGVDVPDGEHDTVQDGRCRKQSEPRSWAPGTPIFDGTHVACATLDLAKSFETDFGVWSAKADRGVI